MRYLHKRRIEVDCWLRDDQRLQVVGEIDDDKGMPFQSYQRLIPAGGNLHTMRVTWIVSEALVVDEAHIEMIDVPGENCYPIAAMAEKLVGLTIVKGFTRELQQRFGGVNGCNHVYALLQAMAPAVLQARYTLQGEARMAAGGWLDLENTCHAFRSDGPLIREMRAQYDVPAKEQ